MSQLKIKNGGSWEAIPAGGVGVPSGGSSGQVLTKSSSVDYATEWDTLLNINPPDIFNATGTSLTANTYLDVTSVGGWYAVRAINETGSGACFASIMDITRTEYLAYESSPDGTWKRAMTPFVYIPTGQQFSVRANFTLKGELLLASEVSSR